MERMSQVAPAMRAHCDGTKREGGGAPVVLTTTSKGGGTTRPGRATTMNTDGGMSFDKRAFRAQREPAGYQDGRSGERT
jgi:hypothetical protein